MKASPFLAAALLLAAPLTPAPAQAQIVSTSPQEFLDNARRQFDEITQKVNDDARNAALNWRTTVYQQTANWDPNVANFVRSTTDGWITAIWPTAIADQEAAAAAARQAAADAARPAAPAAAPTGDCPAGAKACVNTGGRQSWLQDGGRVTYGPVPITSGRPGQETPHGWHQVVRKVRNEVSHEFNNAPMPYSVYFTNSGVAFHEGSLYNESAGCVHLSNEAARYYFDNLQIGDSVYVF